MHHSRVMAGAMTLLLLSAPASWGAAPQKAKAVPAAEPFEGVVIAEGLAAPWDMVWGPDNHIWVSEREGSRIISVDPKTGEKKLVGSIPDVKVGPQHEGVLGSGTIRDFDPFLMLDAFDALNPADYVRGFPLHPHRGIETCT